MADDEDQVDLNALSVADLMQGLTSSVEEWKGLQIQMGQTHDRVVSYRQQLSVLGFNIEIKEFDQTVVGVAQSVAPAVVPGVPDYGDPNFDSTDETVSPDADLPDIPVDEDRRTAAQIRQEAMAVDSATQLQEAQALAINSQGSLDRALASGWRRAEQLVEAEGAQGGVRTRGYR